jgi:integrase
LIEQYVAFRQTLGECFRTTASFLRAFGRAIGVQADIGDVRPEQVSLFLVGTGPITRTWFGKYNALRGFYRYAIGRDYVKASPLPTVLPKRPAPFVPYIYSHQELRRLVDATDTYQERRSCVEPVTIRTMVLLLYGAGLRGREAIALDRADVDLENSLLCVRRTKFYKTRLVPISRQLKDVLTGYAGRCSGGVCVSGESAPFLTTRASARLKHVTLQGCFRRVCEKAGIRRGDGGREQPRLHDLRHTFAVHRLTSWYRQGADVQRLLPQLSVYLGHVHLAATQVYLSMTAELLAQANARFERYTEETNHD